MRISVRKYFCKGLKNCDSFYVLEKKSTLGKYTAKMKPHDEKGEKSYLC